MKYLNRTVIHSLCWAVAMLLAAYFFRDSDYVSKGLFIVLGLWFCSHNWVKNSQCRKSDKTACGTTAGRS